MKQKIFFIAILLICIFGVFEYSYVSAITEQERQSLISQIQQQINALYQQIAQQTGQQNNQQQQNVATNQTCRPFERDILPGDIDTTEVALLQNALQKEGFSRGSDQSGVYGPGTVDAVKKFQIKYKIGSGTGNVGPKTREKLNALYTCPKVSCTPKWQIGPWSVCSNEQQTRIVTDSNKCGTTKNQPAVTQSCKPKVIDIGIDGSDGPVNIFLSLGNGANTSASGITLSKDINLQWYGENISSCVASDNLKPTLFSGYQASSGGQTINVSGVVKNTSSNNKLSVTFKITCVSTINGSTVNDSVTANLFYASNSACSPNWTTGAWGSCVNGKQTRSVIDSNYCGTTLNQPAVTQSCVVCVPNWQTSQWGECINGKQTRTVTDANNCGVTTGKPTTTQTCCSATCLNQADGVYSISCNGLPTKCATGNQCQLTYTSKTVYNNGVATTVETLSGSKCFKPACTPNWQTSQWGECINGKQTRTVTDANNCGVTTGKPTTTQTCCSATCLNQTDGVYTVSCSGSVAKCASGRVCELTYTTSYSYDDGIGHTNQVLSGSRCVCYPSWQTGAWGACTNGQQTRTVIDANNCGVSTDKPATSQSCMP